MPLYDPDARNAAIAAKGHPSRSNGVIGLDPNKPDVVVAANGGSDLVYLPKKDRKLAARVASALLAQDYVSGLFVDDSLGKMLGTLPLTMLKRFYRLEHSRNSPGNGLGLSLVAAVANLHGARIEMADNAPGLRIELHFPSSDDDNIARHRPCPATPTPR